MEARTLGWAGVQLRDGDSSLVIDPLQDAAPTYAAAGDLARDVRMPDVAPAVPGCAFALVTHLHRDHADAAALAAALAPGAPVFVPEPYGGDDVEQSALAQADADLRAAGLEVAEVRAWDRVEIDGWTVTALPAADGTGDPQVSWLVERGDARVVHAGDTLPHGWWWRVARRAAGPIDVAFLPINAARVQFPHRQPAVASPIVMGGRAAAEAALAMGAARVVPMHYGALDFPPFYESDRDAPATLRGAASELGVAVEVPALGEWFGVAAAAAAA
jgi:L-ascorbate metabolism protein UlaG (beta-lactamase superfamily)